MAKERIGFIGVGLMGHGMAANIVDKGWPLTVMGHRNREPVEDLKRRGAAEASTPRELAEASDIVVMCVTGSPQVEAVVTQDDEPRGKTWALIRSREMLRPRPVPVSDAGAATSAGAPSRRMVAVSGTGRWTSWQAARRSMSNGRGPYWKLSPAGSCRRDRLVPAIP